MPSSSPPSSSPRGRGRLSNTTLAALIGGAAGLVVLAVVLVIVLRGSPGGSGREAGRTAEAAKPLEGAARGAERASLLPPGSGPSLARLLPDGKRAVVARGSKAWLYDLATRVPARTYSGHTSGITSLSLSRDGKLLLTGSRDGSARTWEVETGKRKLQTLFRGAVTSVALDPDGQVALVGSRVAEGRDGKPLGKNAVHLHDAKTGKPINQLDFPTYPVVAITNDGNAGLASFEDRPLMVWPLSIRPNPEAGQKPDIRGRACLAPAGPRNVLLGGPDGTVILWDTENTKPLGTYRGHVSGVSDLAVLPDGRRFVSGGEEGDATLRLWDTAGQAEVGRVQLPSAVRSVSVARNGDQVLSTEADGSVRLFALDSIGRR